MLKKLAAASLIGLTTVSALPQHLMNSVQELMKDPKMSQWGKRIESQPAVQALENNQEIKTMAQQVMNREAGALEKLLANPQVQAAIKQITGDMTDEDKEQIAQAAKNAKIGSIRRL